MLVLKASDGALERKLRSLIKVRQAVRVEIKTALVRSQQNANSRDMWVKSRLCSKRTFYSAAWKRCSSMGIAACQRED
jgi:hypothetical protein